ncbi:hypothetical protein [Acrocarpospora catenulata]|uniref:hypothetical protein n=1 Tax=Acrocarpospora catenulata TaxID=2836182 RepID=UPI001BD9AF37|nr:hypothetical protein [Acrocarpospora catenulata]
MTPDLYVVGSAWRTVGDDTDLQLDELVFECCSAALRDAGVRRHQIGLAITSSLDLYDARSISNALTAPAAAGYLNDELRVEGDASAALLVALAGLAGGAVDFAIVAGIHVPEIGGLAERAVRRLDQHVSSYTFDAHLDRPVGMTSSVTLGLHAAERIDAGQARFEELAAATAAEITRGAARRGTRPAVTAAEVAAAPMAVAPLTELMLPAASAGVGAVVLAAGVSARRCPRPRARIAGWGSATAPATANPGWLADPGAATAVARTRAYAMAGLDHPAEQVGSVELTDLSPALSAEIRSALDLDGLDAPRINRSGGVRANYPGIANGLLRVVETLDNLADDHGGVAVVHAADDLCGLVSSTVNVLVLEGV